VREFRSVDLRVREFPVTKSYLRDDADRR
jgi:hypothetical protein